MRIPSVSEKVYEQVFQVVRDLQEKSPRRPVTQKQTCDKLKQAFARAHLTDRHTCMHNRHVRRAFRKLREDGRIIRYNRGQYWLPEYLKKTKEYLKRQQELEKEFWGTTNEILAKRIIELRGKLLQLELNYEGEMDQIEKQEILRKDREKGNSH